ncbi:M1 family metallopeptidase [Haliangium sp.]|uniref:M1 family metallopeptidase n=1 Tax=Haliangium sp. TaxID=2663208 RepID=UPI003D09FBB5
MRVCSWLLPCVLASACGSAPEPETTPLPAPDLRPPLLDGVPRSPRLANYRIDARLDVDTWQVDARQTLTWTNSSQRPVERLPFHLYMNAFESEATVFMREAQGQHRRARASDTGWGWIDVDRVAVAGRDLSAALRTPGPDRTVVELVLPEPVAPGAQIEVEMDFRVQFPEVFARTGHKGWFLMAGQWFPKIGVLTGPPGTERWRCEPFHLMSEFFADFGTYDVALTVPDTLVVAATGVLQAAEDHGDGTRTLRYRAEDVHDFAWMADPFMQVVRGQAETELGQVEVRVYHRPGQEAFARRHLQAGIGTIEVLSRWLVPYPWPIMSIIDPPPDATAGAGGMEYPTLVTTAGDMPLMRPGVRLPEFITVHEVGHNWFQGILASNEVEEAWLDEGVNDYADAVVMDELFGERTSGIDWNGLHARWAELSSAGAGGFAHLPVPIATRSYEFPDFGAYGAATYRKTAAALATLERTVGREPFRAAMRAYAQRYGFRHPTGEEFFAALEQALGQELDWFLDPAFRQVGDAAFAVREVNCRAGHELRGAFPRDDGDGERRVVSREQAPDRDDWVCEVLVVNTGAVSVPVEVEIEFDDGARLRERWDTAGHQRWQRWRIAHSARVAQVVVDPDRQVLLYDGSRRGTWRRVGDGSASWRVGARLGYWAQTLMQVLGP